MLHRHRVCIFASMEFSNLPISAVFSILSFKAIGLILTIVVRRSISRRLNEYFRTHSQIDRNFFFNLFLVYCDVSSFRCSNKYFPCQLIREKTKRPTWWRISLDGRLLRWQETETRYFKFAFSDDSTVRSNFRHSYHLSFLIIIIVSLAPVSDDGSSWFHD